MFKRLCFKLHNFKINLIVEKYVIIDPLWTYFITPNIELLTIYLILYNFSRANINHIKRPSIETQKVTHINHV